MTWQVNWKVWHWPWYHKKTTHLDYGPGIVTYCDNWAGIGPFQFHWYSKN